jgi:hypothetical protein
VAEAYVVTKREPVKYCTYISVCGLTVGNRETHMRASPHTCAVMPWGGILGLAWDVAVMMPLQGSPPPRGRRPRGLIWMALGGCGRAERRQCRERRRGVQKPLAACQAKMVPGAVLLAAVGRSVPGGPPQPLAGENLGSGRRRAEGPGPWAARRRCRVGAGYESEGGHLVLLCRRCAA